MKWHATYNFFYLVYDRTIKKERADMQLFNKKNKISDRYFAKLTLSKNQNKKLLSYLTDEEERKSFPNVTFETLEKMMLVFLKECKENQGAIIPKIELVMNQGEKASSENELFLKYFELDENYQNILKPISEAMFNLMPFSAAPFEDKVTYLKLVFESWQESTKLSEEHWPILPDFELDDEEYVEFIIPYYQEHSILEFDTHQASNEQVEKLQKETTKELVEAETKELEEPEVIEEIVTFIQEIPESNRKKGKLSDQILSGTKANTFQPELITFTPYSFEQIDGTPYYNNQNITEVITRANDEISQFNIKSQLLQEQIFHKKLERFELEQKNKIALEIQSQDQRENLRKQIIDSNRKTLQESVSFESKRIYKNKELELLKEQESYKAKVLKINSEAQLAIEEKTFSLKQEVKYKTQQEILQALQDETDKLEEQLRSELLNLEQSKKVEAEKISRELKEVVVTQNNALKGYYLDKLPIPPEKLVFKPLDKDKNEEKKSEIEENTVETGEPP